MVQIYFATDTTKQDNRQLVLEWLEKDFREKHQPKNHFWYNRVTIADAFDACRGMVVRDDHQQFIGFMAWSFYGDKVGAEIDIVEIEESYRGQGIFKQILSAFSNYFPQLAVLSVSALPQAQPIFEKMGWQRAATSSTMLPAISDRIFFKILKTPTPFSNTLPNGISIAICSEDFYQVKTSPQRYADKTYFLSPVTGHEYSLTQPVVATCHKDGYLGFYLNQQLVYECKPKLLTNSVDCHHAIVLLNQFPATILTAFKAHAASIETSGKEQAGDEPARKMMRGKNAARIKVQAPAEQVVLFTKPPENIGDLSSNEIHQAVLRFCEQDQSYDGQSLLNTTQWFRYPLIFFLLESYHHEHYTAATDNAALLTSITRVTNRYPNSRQAVFNGQDLFSFCAYHSLCGLLKVIEPSAVELANSDLHCTAVEAALIALDPTDEQSLETLKYLLQTLGSTISNEFWAVKIKEIFKSKYYSAREETPSQRQHHLQVMQLMLDWNIVSLSQEFVLELTEVASPEIETILDRGIWVRSVADLAGEIAILDKRELLTDEKLSSMRHAQEEQGKASYTDYSPANFVCGYAQYNFYDSHCAGIAMDTGNGPFSYWQDGTGREMLSREMDFTQAKLFNEEDYSSQFSEVGKLQMLEHIQLLQANHLQTYDQSPKANQVTDQQAHITLTVPIIFQPPQWNEGLLRYKKKHIAGFYVYPEKKESVINAAALRQALQLNALPVFALSEKTSSLTQVDLSQLITTHSITQEMLDEALKPKQHTNFIRGSSALYSSSSEEEEESDDEHTCAYEH